MDLLIIVIKDKSQKTSKQKQNKTFFPYHWPVADTGLYININCN